jgi:hypothetical protein
MIRTALTAAALVTAALIAISSSAIGSGTTAGAPSSQDLQMTQIANDYAFGGASYTILSGVTVMEKSATGCATDVTHIVTVPRQDTPTVAKKSDRLPSFGCTLIALK